MLLDKRHFSVFGNDAIHPHALVSHIFALPWLNFTSVRKRIRKKDFFLVTNVMSGGR